MIRVLLAVLALLLASHARAQDTEHEAKDEKAGKKGEGVRFVWKKHPSLRFGDMFRVDFRYRVQMEWSYYDPEVKKSPQPFDFGRNRFGVEGTALRDNIEYEFSYEFAETDFHLKDFYANLRFIRKAQIRGGRFRIPFSLDQLTGPTNLDFIERSRIADRLAPNRDTGVMAHGAFFSQALKYQFGYFLNDGDNGADKNNVRTGQGTYAGRLTGRPLDPLSPPGILRTFTVGGAFTTSNVPEGLYSLRLRTVSKETIFPYAFVNGRRTRSGAEMSWMPGPFSLKGEFIDVHEERHGQGLLGNDLPDLMERGWYLSGTWAVTGQPKARGLDRGRIIPFVQGWGALELAIRNEAIRFGSDGGTGRPSRSIRASNVLPQSERVWTFGVNWYANQWAKVQSNFVREWIEDAFRAPIAGRNVYWSYKVRLQLSL